MAISLVQRVSPRGTLHVWIAVTRVTAAPPLVWTLDGANVVPRAMRPLESARTPQMVNANTGRAFTGLFEFADPNPAVPHVVRVNAGGQLAALTVRAVPAAVPQTSMSGQALRILLVSCFHIRSDPAGKHVARHGAEFLRRHRPDLSLFLGDQVYLDLPLEETPAGNLPAIAQDIERKYLNNWLPRSVQPFQRGYYELLSAAPSIFTADDHEYWNNFPHFQAQLKNTWKPELRAAWTSAAERMWSMFQLQHGVPLGRPFVINDVAPLSILFVDTRSMRKNGVLFDAAGAAVVNGWANALAASPDRVGLMVSGQSIFDRKTLGGSLLDKNLLDFPNEYKVLAGAVRRASARRPVLCVTGDVHYGRVLAIRGSEQAGRLFEIISSPAALVDNPIKNATVAINPFDDPVWPKHSTAPSADEELRFDAFPGQQHANAHAQRGNHIAMLSLTRTGTAVHVEVRFKPMHETRDLPEEVARFTLR